MVDTPNAVEYHADALDERGRELPDRTYGWEMPVLADCKTLDAARAWAQRIFAADDRVASVAIRESIQQYAGGSWRLGRQVEQIGRDDSSPPAAAGASLGHPDLTTPAPAPAAGAPAAAGRAFPPLRPGSAPATACADIPPPPAGSPRSSHRR